MVNSIGDDGKVKPRTFEEINAGTGRDPQFDAMRSRFERLAAIDAQKEAQDKAELEAKRQASRDAFDADAKYKEGSLAADRKANLGYKLTSIENLELQSDAKIPPEDGRYAWAAYAKDEPPSTDKSLNEIGVIGTSVLSEAEKAPAGERLGKYSEIAEKVLNYAAIPAGSDSAMGRLQERYESGKITDDEKRLLETDKKSVETAGTALETLKEAKATYEQKLEKLNEEQPFQEGDSEEAKAANAERITERRKIEEEYTKAVTSSLEVAREMATQQRLNEAQAVLLDPDAKPIDKLRAETQVEVYQAELADIVVPRQLRETEQKIADLENSIKARNEENTKDLTVIKEAAYSTEQTPEADQKNAARRDTLAEIATRNGFEELSTAREDRLSRLNNIPDYIPAIDGESVRINEQRQQEMEKIAREVGGAEAYGNYLNQLKALDKQTPFIAEGDGENDRANQQRIEMRAKIEAEYQAKLTQAIEQKYSTDLSTAVNDKNTAAVTKLQGERSEALTDAHLYEDQIKEIQKRRPLDVVSESRGADEHQAEVQKGKDARAALRSNDLDGYVDVMSGRIAADFDKQIEEARAKGATPEAIEDLQADKTRRLEQLNSLKENTTLASQFKDASDKIDASNNIPTAQKMSVRVDLLETVTELGVAGQQFDSAKFLRGEYEGTSSENKKLLKSADVAPVSLAKKAEELGIHPSDIFMVELKRDGRVEMIGRGGITVSFHDNDILKNGLDLEGMRQKDRLYVRVEAHSGVDKEHPLNVYNSEGKNVRLMAGGLNGSSSEEYRLQAEAMNNVKVVGDNPNLSNNADEVGMRMRVAAARKEYSEGHRLAKSMDVNKDGRVTGDEVLVALDRDGDGKLQQNELEGGAAAKALAAMAKDNPAFAESLAKLKQNGGAIEVNNSDLNSLVAQVPQRAGQAQGRNT